MREAAAQAATTAEGRGDGGDRLLDIRDLSAFYGDFQALFSISLSVAPGQVVAVIGANGAGKSTLLKSIAGLMERTAGEIRYRGDHHGRRDPGGDLGDPRGDLRGLADDIRGLRADLVVARGIALVPEGRRLFPSLTVEENLLIGGRLKRPGPWSLVRIYELFPVLGERRTMPSTALSGGQQQMVAIGRALMSNPRLLLCDEISLGLAPIVIRDIYKILPQLSAEGVALVIVEQDIVQALKVADHVVCLQEGRIALEGSPKSLTRAEISAAYFGI